MNFSKNEKFVKQNFVENQNSSFMFNEFFLFLNHAFFLVMWEIVVDRDRPQCQYIIPHAHYILDT